MLGQPSPNPVSPLVPIREEHCLQVWCRSACVCRVSLPKLINAWSHRLTYTPRSLKIYITDLGAKKTIVCAQNTILLSWPKEARNCWSLIENQEYSFSVLNWLRNDFESHMIHEACPPVPCLIWSYKLMGWNTVLLDCLFTNFAIKFKVCYCLIKWMRRHQVKCEMYKFMRNYTINAFLGLLIL